MTTILPISVLYKIREYLVDEYIIYLDEKSGCIVKKLINSKKSPECCSDSIYNYSDRYHYCNYDYNYKILTNKYENFHLVDNKWQLVDRNIFNNDNNYFYKDNIICNNLEINPPYRNYTLFGFDNDNTVFISNSIRHHYYHLIINDNNDYIKIRDVHFPFIFKQFIGSIFSGNYYNLHWVLNEFDASWSLVIVNKDKYKKYDKNYPYNR